MKSTSLKSAIGIAFFFAMGILATVSCKKEKSVFAVADFTYSGRIDTIPSTIQFINTSIGFSYIWDFGDGSSSTDKNPSHTFNQAGTYNVKLIAKGTNNSDTMVIKLLITFIPPIVLDDFEDGLSNSWTTFIQSGTNMKFSVDTTPPLAEGNQHYKMGGRVEWDWLLGMLTINAATFNSIAGFGLPNNAASVYFNGIYRRPVNLINSIVMLRFCEDDNGDGTFNSSNEDMWAIQIQPGPSWELKSIRYIDMAPVSTGNAVYEPNKLHRVEILFLANPVSGYAECDIDLLAFSINQSIQL
jgi:hypothetical protein